MLGRMARSSAIMPTYDGPLLTFYAAIMTDPDREIMMEPMAHAGAMRQFVLFARSTGLSLDEILDEELKAVADSSATAERVPASAMVDMMQVCAAVSGRPDLGVAFAMWGNLRGYGPLSLLWDHCPTLAEMFRVNQRYVHLESAALATRIEEEGDETAVRHLLLVPVRYGGSQFIEGTMALGMRVARLILGEDWAPLRFEFDHSAPRDTRYLRGILRCPMEFRADRNAMVVRKSDMTRPSPAGNAHMLAYLERHMASMDQVRPVDLLQQVEQFIAANLMNGGATLPNVAALSAMSPRTLQRQLSARGVSFADVLAGVRKRTAEEYFRTESRPNLTQLAYRLGYADASAASRYLRTHLDTGTRAFRASIRF